MVVEPLVKVAIVAPKNEISEVTKGLYKISTFHIIEEDGEEYEDHLKPVIEGAKRLLLDLEVITNELEIRPSQGVIDVLIKGQELKKEKLTVKDWSDLVSKLEHEARPILNELNKLVSMRREINAKLSELEPLLSGLWLVSSFAIDLQSTKSLKRIFVFFAITRTKDIPEIARSLPESTLVDVQLTKAQSAVLVVTHSDDLERIERVMKGLGIREFKIPEGMPQRPSEAYRLVSDQVDKLRSRLIGIQNDLKLKVEKYREKILSLYEAVTSVKNALEKFKKNEGLNKLAVIQGYVPKSIINKVYEHVGHKYPTYVTEINMSNHNRGHSNEKVPTLMKNRSVFSFFENITLFKGPPAYGEMDPTPLIALFFSAFYGIMFADFGQGLILAVLGLIIYRRASENLKLWGGLLTVLGISASLSGLAVGEAFGFPIPFYHPLIEIIEKKERTISQEAVLTLIATSLLLGVTHLTLAYVISTVKAARHHDFKELTFSKIPTLVMYISGFMFGLAFIGANNNFSMIFESSNPAPLIGIESSLLAKLAVPLAVGSIIFIIFAKPLARSFGIIKEGSILGYLGFGLLEVLENMIAFLANTVSYVRIAILLLVHASLLMVLNMAWDMGPASIPLLIIGNVGIMALEGLIAFIQALRLHLYEWFTKFFEGTGEKFKPIAQPSHRTEIEFSS